MSYKIREYTVKKLIESYGSFYMDYNGEEARGVCPMTFKQAKFLAKKWDGYVVTLDPVATGVGFGIYIS